MTKQGYGRHGLLAYAGLSLLAVALIALGLTTLCSAQEESAVERYYRLLSRISDEALLRIPAAMAELDTLGEDGRKAFQENPRAYLETKGVDLPVNYYQVVALRFEDNLDPKTAWFGVAEQQEELTFVAAGIGLFYDNVGIFIQTAIVPPSSPAGGPVPAFSTTGPEPMQGIESYLQLIERIPSEALGRLPTVMEELNAAKEDDPQRVEFIANPRDYLLKRDILLPGAYYRIVALDFQRAAKLEVPPVVAAKTRGGLAVVPEGIGFFFENAGIFIQEAI